MIQMEMGLEIILHRQKYGRKITHGEQCIMDKALGLNAVGAELFTCVDKSAIPPVETGIGLDIRVSTLRPKDPSVVAVMLTTSEKMSGLQTCTAPWRKWSPY